MDILNKIKVITQSSIRIETERGVAYFDPIGIKGRPGDADFIFVTHDHSDHFSPDDIAKIAKPDTKLVVPTKMAEQAKGVAGSVTTVMPGKNYEIGGLGFETVPAYNNHKPFHPKRANWVGYIIKTNGCRIYVSGDTDVTKENRRVRCDIAMVPVGGKFTMDAGEAAELINEIKPQVAIPTHYGTIVGKPGDGKKFAGLVEPPVKVEIKL